MIEKPANYDYTTKERQKKLRDKRRDDPDAPVEFRRTVTQEQYDLLDAYLKELRGEGD